MLITAGTVKVTLHMGTLTDNLLEDDEYFRATLSLFGAPEAVVVGSPNMAFITIADDTRMLGLLIPIHCMPQLEFSTICP